MLVAFLKSSVSSATTIATHNAIVCITDVSASTKIGKVILINGFLIV